MVRKNQYQKTPSNEHLPHKLSLSHNHTTKLSKLRQRTRPFSVSKSKTRFEKHLHPACTDRALHLRVLTSATVAIFRNAELKLSEGVSSYQLRANVHQA